MAERTVRKGDWAIIHIGTFSKEYTITDITPDGDIHLETPEGVVIVRNIDNSWQVYGANAPNWVEFMEPRSGLSELEEMNMQIMVNLPLKDIESMCRTSPMFRSICGKEYFWKTKFNHDYRKDPKNVASWEKLYKSYGEIYISGEFHYSEVVDDQVVTRSTVHEYLTPLAQTKGIYCFIGRYLLNFQTL